MGNSSSELAPGTTADEAKFMQAVAEGKVEDAAAVLSFKPSAINAHLRDGQNAWHITARTGNLKLMELLQKFSKTGERRPLPGQPRLVCQRNKKGHTPLMDACEAGQTEAMQFLLLCGAEVDNGDQFGNTALHYAALKGHAKALEILFASEDPTNTNPDTKYVNLRNNNDLTPLHFASWGGSAEAARVLLSYGARLVAQSSSDSLSLITCNGGSTPLHLAVMKGQERVVKVLLDAYVQIITADSAAGRGVTCPDPRSIEDSYQCTPYQVALNLRRDTLALMVDPDQPLDIGPRPSAANARAAAAAAANRATTSAQATNSKAAEAAAAAAGFPPPRFVCPITNAPMDDPVTAADGVTYERSAITMWFEVGNTEFPGARSVKISSKELRSDEALRVEIQEWKSSQGL